MQTSFIFTFFFSQAVTSAVGSSFLSELLQLEVERAATEQHCCIAGNARSRLRRGRRLCANKTDSEFGLKVSENYAAAVPSRLLSQQTANKNRNSFCDGQLCLVCCPSVAVCIQFLATSTIPHFALLCPILAFYRLSCTDRAIPMPGMLVVHTLGQKKSPQKNKKPIQDY